MPFVRERLTRLLPAMAAAGTRHASLWFYSTTDPDVMGAWYFDNEAARHVQNGDVIIAVANIAATPIVRVLVVSNTTGQGVVVNNITTT